MQVDPLGVRRVGGHGLAVQKRAVQAQAGVALFKLRQMVGVTNQVGLRLRALGGKGGVFPRLGEVVELAGKYQRGALRVSAKALKIQQALAVLLVAQLRGVIHAHNLPIQRLAKTSADLGVLKR